MSGCRPPAPFLLLVVSPGRRVVVRPLVLVRTPVVFWSYLFLLLIGLPGSAHSAIGAGTGLLIGFVLLTAARGVVITCCCW